MNTGLKNKGEMQMKARTDCTKCRVAIYKQAQTDYLKEQYKWHADNADSFAAFTTVCAIAVMERRGRSSEYIKKFFEDLCFIYDYPEFHGKRVDMVETIKQYAEKYGLDFGKIHLHLQTEKEFVDSMSEGR